MAEAPFDPNNPFGPFFNPFQAYFTGLEAMSQNLGPLTGTLKTVARCQLEVVGLMSRRAQAYMEIPTRLGQCRSVQDVAGEQVRFWQTAFEQYTETSRRVMEACGEAATGGGRNGKTTADRERDYIKFPGADNAASQRTSAPPRRDQRRVA